MNMLWVSFGYGINISPLHTLTLYNAVANNGKMMRPYLVSSVRTGGTVHRIIEPQVIEEQLCKPSVISAARSAMEMVVTEGTAKKVLKDLPFTAAGKTGTAHVSDGKIRYSDGVYQASFVGYFPAERPQYTIIVVIRTKPHAASHFGGTLAAPVFREIATRLYSLYVEKKDPSLFTARKDSSAYFYAGSTVDIKNVMKKMQVKYNDQANKQNWSNVYAIEHQPVIKPVTVKDGVMPNVRGMGLRDALFLLENRGIKVVVKGKGKVMGQSVMPGTPVVKGVTVVLDLS
jgi:cell division protein FtsI (penicillin-binding protein 3)